MLFMPRKIRDPLGQAGIPRAYKTNSAARRAAEAVARKNPGEWVTVQPAGDVWLLAITDGPHGKAKRYVC